MAGVPGYAVLRTLGRGNTSSVYLATPPPGLRPPGSAVALGPGSTVALKVPFAHTLADPGAATRFGNEVRMALQLRHPHLVGGLQGQPHGAGAYLAMHYFPGGALSERLARGERVGAEAALRIGADLCAALEHLHGLRAVHQDVKPQNVYLDGGRAALGDFGCAYFLSQGGASAGSPHYMAPEIFMAESGTPASDVYSLGVLLYELLTGERPFVGDSYDALMYRHLNHVPLGLCRRVPELSGALPALLAAALAKRPDARPTAADLGAALRAALGEQPEPEALAPALGRHARRTLPDTAAAKAPAAKPGRGWLERWRRR